MGKKRDLINNSVWIFFKKNQRYKTICLCLFIFAPILLSIIIIFFLALCKWDIDIVKRIFYCFLEKSSELLGLYGVYLSICGIFISALVLMSISKDKTLTTEDYLCNLQHIFEHAEDNDVIYWIAPTFCSGYTHMREQLDKIYDILTKKIPKITLNCAFLNISDELGERNMDRINFQNARPDDDHHWKMYSVFLEKKFTEEKSKSHYIDICVKGINSYWNKLYRFVDNTPEQHLYHSGLDIHKYIVYTDEAQNIFNGFFAIANVTKGLYYMGAFQNIEITTTFSGTMFENKEIGTQMRQFFENFINEKKFCSS